MSVDALRDALGDALAFIRGDISGSSQREGILREGEAALAASGMETRSATDPQGRGPEGDSPAPEGGDAQ